MQFVSAGFILPPAVDVNFPSPITVSYTHLPLPVPPDGLLLGKDSCKGRINTPVLRLRTLQP